MLKRVVPAIAGLVVVAALAVVVPTATGHPEECAGTAAWASTDGGYSPYLSWQGAAESSCASSAVTSRYDDSGAKLAKGESGTAGLRLIASRAKQGEFTDYGDFNSDLAFEDGFAYQGNYEGVTIWDVRDPSNPTLAGQIECTGSQNDVTINDGILITSTDSRRTDDGCKSSSVPSPTAASPDPPGVWEGLKVWNVEDPTDPDLLTTVQTDCGSHTHTVLPEADRLLVYVQSYDVGAGRTNCDTGEDGANSHDKISIVEVPKDDPGSAEVIAEPVLFPDGGGDATTGTRRATTGCHDITVYQKIGLAAGACTGEGAIIDIRDPEDPKVLASVEDPNFAFWHSATISQDGKKVLFTDELGGGGGPECNPTIGPNRGADAIYDISDPANPQFLSYFKMPRTQNNSENCVAHNGNAIPIPGRDVLVQSWYQGGISVIDWTDGTKPRELAWFDRGPWENQESPIRLAGFWSSYYYNGFIYGSEIQRGFDVFKATGSELSGADRSRTGTLNAQTQF